MGNFRQHITWGALASAGFVVVLLVYSYVTDPALLAVVFGIGMVGSFAPDLDSDSSLPYQIIFGAFTALCAGATLYYLLATGVTDWRWLIGWPAAVLVFVWYVIGYVFQKFTKHRGMFHSVPAILIAGLSTYLLALELGSDTLTARAIGAGMGVGYLAHLSLDELHAGVNLQGKLFVPNKAFGTALKLLSRNRMKNLLTYGLLAMLVYLTTRTL